MTMFKIEGHTYAQADSPNRVALYIGGDVYTTGAAFSRQEIAESCAALEVGQLITFNRIPWANVDHTRPVVVTRIR